MQQMGVRPAVAPRQQAVDRRCAGGGNDVPPAVLTLHTAVGLTPAVDMEAPTLAAREDQHEHAKVSGGA